MKRAKKLTRNQRVRANRKAAAEEIQKAASGKLRKINPLFSLSAYLAHKAKARADLLLHREEKRHAKLDAEHRHEHNHDHDHEHETDEVLEVVDDEVINDSV